MASSDVTVHVADLPAVRDLMARASAEIERLEGEVERLQAQRQAVLDLHREHGPTGNGIHCCQADLDTWPCATVRALASEAHPVDVVDDSDPDETAPSAPDLMAPLRAIPDDLVAVGAKALHHAEWTDGGFREMDAEECWAQDPDDHAGYYEQSRIVLAAAWPEIEQHWRRHIADQIEAIPLRWAGGSSDDLKSGPTMRDEAVTAARGEGDQ